MRSVLWSIFAAVLSLFVASAVAAQQGNYRIQPGDSLRVEVLEDSSLNRSVLVLPDGRISFPLAGAVTAGGRTTGQVERNIATKIAPNFANPPTVFVAVIGIPQDRGTAGAEEEDETVLVYLVGEVAQPGPKSVKRGSTVLQVLSQAGGFTPFAATKRIQLRSHTTGSEKIYLINYQALGRGARFNKDIHVHEGDVILVPERRLFE